MTIFSKALTDLAEKVISEARKKKLRIVTAESCTGGLATASLVDIPGASDVFDRGFIAYSNDSKMAQLSVGRKTLADFGAVSAETAVEMAEGAINTSHADLAVAITGIAGPGGGTKDKPVGLVYIALANSRARDKHVLLKNNFTGDRGAIRLAAVEAALKALISEIGKM